MARTGEPLAGRVLVAVAALAMALALHVLWNSPPLASRLDGGGVVGMAVFLPLKDLPVLIAVVLPWRVVRQAGAQGR